MRQTATTRRSFLDILVEPHPAIRGRSARQRASLLAGITLTMTVLSLPSTLYAMIVLGEIRAAIGLVHGGLLLICYALSRTRYAAWGSIALVGGETLLNFGTLLSIPDPSVSTAIIAFMLLPMLFSTVLLPARFTLALVVVVDVALGLFAAFSPWVTFSDLFVPALATALISILAAVAAFLRERDLIVIEQQSEELTRRSRLLENEADERTRAIMITADIGKLTTGARDVDMMLRQVTNLIIERFNFYHALVFLVDPSGRQAKLHAASGPSGDELMTRGHSLLITVPSVVTKVITKGETVTVSDTDIDPIHRRNELMPNTRSEIGVPMRASGQVIGALNIHSAQPNAFKLADATVFQTVADQLAIAVENARLFQRAARDLQDIETLNRQLTGEAWRNYLTGRSPSAPVGFASTGGAVVPITPSDGTSSEPTDGTISLPLKIRGETIGMLDITSRSGEVPDEETRNMLEAVAERVALALDSTRLGEQAQRQAEREQILSKISADLQATTDMNAILRIVAREASRALGASRSFVHLSMEYGKGSEQ